MKLTANTEGFFDMFKKKSLPPPKAETKKFIELDELPDSTVKQIVKECEVALAPLKKFLEDFEKKNAAEIKEWGFRYTFWDENKRDITDWYLINYEWFKSAVSSNKFMEFDEKLVSIVESAYTSHGWKVEKGEHQRVLTKTIDGVKVVIDLYAGDNDGNNIGPDVVKGATESMKSDIDASIENLRDVVETLKQFESKKEILALIRKDDFVAELLNGLTDEQCVAKLENILAVNESALDLNKEMQALADILTRHAPAKWESVHVVHSDEDGVVGFDTWAIVDGKNTPIELNDATTRQLEDEFKKIHAKVKKTWKKASFVLNKDGQGDLEFSYDSNQTEHHTFGTGNVVAELGKFGYKPVVEGKWTYYEKEIAAGKYKLLTAVSEDRLQTFTKAGGKVEDIEKTFKDLAHGFDNIVTELAKTLHGKTFAEKDQKDPKKVTVEEIEKLITQKPIKSYFQGKNDGIADVEIGFSDGRLFWGHTIIIEIKNNKWNGKYELFG